MFEKLSKIFLCLLFSTHLFSSVASKDIKVSCKNEKGQSVDWFYLYKLPAYYSADKSKHLDKSGLSYMFLTDTYSGEWTLSKNKINESTSITAQTLQPLFDDPLVLLLAYNDEFPNGQVVPTGGHTKGVVATDGNTGIWFIHSVPKFSSIPKYEYPTTGTHYGQSFLCLTLNATEMEKVGEQLLFNEPNIYFERLPVTLSEKFPLLEKVVQKQWIHLAPYNNVLDIESLAGTVFKSFAKTTKFKQELYEDFVAPTLDTNLLVETWKNGGGNFHSNCSLNDNVYNVEAIQMQQFNIDFPSTVDHSKWAVSQSVGLKFWRWRIPSTTNWICVGDINRQQHQVVRGGGVVCQRHKNVAKLFRNLVKKYESCSKS